MLPTEVVGFCFLLLLLQGLQCFALLVCLPRLVRSGFLGRNLFPLDVGVIVRSSTGRTQPIQVSLYIVITELTDLQAEVST